MGFVTSSNLDLCRVVTDYTPAGVFTCLLTFAIVQIVQLHNKGKMNKYKWLTAVAMFLL